jgi:hypothetical protein
MVPDTRKHRLLWLPLLPRGSGKFRSSVQHKHCTHYLLGESLPLPGSSRVYFVPMLWLGHAKIHRDRLVVLCDYGASSCPTVLCIWHLYKGPINSMTVVGFLPVIQLLHPRWRRGGPWNILNTTEHQQETRSSFRKTCAQVPEKLASLTHLTAQKAGK